MSTEIPARLHARVRIERIDTGLGRGRVENELCLPVLLKHGIIVAHDNRAVGIAVGSNSQSEQAEIDTKCDDRSREEEEKQAHKGLPKPLPKFRCRQRHEARL